MPGDASRQVLEDVARRFGIGPIAAEPVALTEAWSNDVFRVLTGSGAYAVKLLSHDLGTALRTGIAVERAAMRTGRIPMAAPVTDPDTGDWLARVQTPGGARWARCHSWVEGRPGSQVPPSTPLAREVGRTLAVLHALRLPGADTRVLDPVDLERWYRAVAAASRREAPWAGKLAALSPLVEHLSGEVEALRSQRRPMRMSHRDLDPKNAVVRADGRVAVTDWDYAGPVLAEVELVVAAVSFCGGLPAADADLVGEFVSAYRDAGGNAGPADDLAVTAEAARDVDWLLRTVAEALTADPAAGTDGVRELVDSFAAAPDSLRRWARVVHSVDAV